MQLSEFTLSFKANIKQIDDASTSESGPDKLRPLGLDIPDKYTLGKVMTGSYSMNSTSSRRSTKESEFSFEVQVKAVRAEAPVGFQKLIDALQTSVSDRTNPAPL